VHLAGSRTLFVGGRQPPKCTQASAAQLHARLTHHIPRWLAHEAHWRGAQRPILVPLSC
jgi:hypothetical protein